MIWLVTNTAAIVFRQTLSRFSYCKIPLGRQNQNYQNQIPNLHPVISLFFTAAQNQKQWGGSGRPWTPSSPFRSDKLFPKPSLSVRIYLYKHTYIYIMYLYMYLCMHNMHMSCMHVYWNINWLYQLITWFELSIANYL